MFLSKQYSDSLSKVVTRGLYKSAEEGRWLNSPKHGYYKDKVHRMHPDGANYVLIKKAWKMRAEGVILEDIAEYLNSKGYNKPEKNNPNKRKPSFMDKRKLSVMFKDSTYTGIMEYGGEYVDLVKEYGFSPVVSVSGYCKINNIKKDDYKEAIKKINATRSSKNVMGRLLNGKVICGHCGNNMYVAIGPKNRGRKFYYRCDYEKCGFRNKSKERFRHHIRAKVIVDFVIEFLRKNDLATREIYDHYVDDAKKVQKEKLHFLKHEKKSLIEKQKRLDNKIKKIKEYLLDADEDLKEDYENDLKLAKTQLKETQALSKKIDEKIEENKVSLLTFSKFTEQVRKIPDEIEKTKILKRKDYLIQKIFSNITTKDKKVASYQLNEPFSTFEKKGFFTKCRGGGT